MEGCSCRQDFKTDGWQGGDATALFFPSLPAPAHQPLHFKAHGCRDRSTENKRWKKKCKGVLPLALSMMRS